MAVRDDARLLGALRIAARSLTDTRRPDLDGAIQRIVTAAVDTVAPAVGGSISRTDREMVRSAYATSEDVLALDELQARLHQGPCISAMERSSSSAVVLARDLSGPDQDRWPAFAPRAARLGYRSLMSLQLSGAPGRHSALNLYARRPDAFDEEALTTAGLFSFQAGILLHGVSGAENLRRALPTRDVIGQAKGVLTERFRLGDNDAFQMLVEASQSTNTKLVVVARWLLDDARRTVTGPVSAPPPTPTKPGSTAT
jgi:hypothetical protein